MADKLWRIRVTASGYQFLPGEDKQFGALGRSLMGKDCQIMLREEPRQRTINQNRYIHAEVFPKMTAWMGDTDPAQCKLAMLGECFGYEWNDKVNHYLPRRTSTAGLSVQEMCDFIEWAPGWAAAFTEGAVIILLPNESIWDEGPT